MAIVASEIKQYKASTNTDHTGGFSMSIRKENGDSLGYIRAGSGKIAVKLLY